MKVISVVSDVYLSLLQKKQKQKNPSGSGFLKKKPGFSEL